MGLPKKPKDFSGLYKTSENTSPLDDKKKVEALKQRLNNLILKDEKLQKKAALILELWLKKSRP
jgi:hypothetical protein